MKFPGCPEARMAQCRGEQAPIFWVFIQGLASISIFWPCSPAWPCDWDALAFLELLSWLSRHSSPSQLPRGNVTLPAFWAAPISEQTLGQTPESLRTSSTLRHAAHPARLGPPFLPPGQSSPLPTHPMVLKSSSGGT